MNQRTTSFLAEMFSEYYRSAPFYLPPRFGRREWGFFLFGGKGMVRPVAFRTRKEARAFLISRAPRHAYFSSAYYEDPSVPMAEKKWLGADLVFDLDADHLPGAEDMSYPEMLAAVKKEFIKLVDEFLLGDMGFDEKDVEIVFSGGRGYHAHVRDRRVLRLGTHERREIVDYVTGKGIDFRRFLVVERWEDRSGPVVRTREALRLPPRDAPGWMGRINRAVRELGRRLSYMEPEEMEKLFLSIEGVGKKTARQLIQQLHEPWHGYPTRLDAIIDGYEYSIDSWGGGRVASAVTRAFLEMARREVAVVSAETDEPVTSDVKRLIRMPGSLHGKTALRVVPMKRSDLDDFNPLRDAVAFDPENTELWGGRESGAARGGRKIPETIKVRVEREITCPLAGREKRYTEGEWEVDLATGMFLLCRGVGEKV